MGNAPLEKKSAGPNQTTGTSPTTQSRTNSTRTANNNLTNNNSNTNINKKPTPVEESDSDESTDSSNGNYGFDISQSISNSSDANYSLLDLPNEILCLLIAHLEAKDDIRSLMFTSKVFVELVYYSWSRLSMQYDNKLTYHQILALPAERLQYLIELDISHCTKMTNALFNQIMDKTPNLKVLKMKGCARLTRFAFSKLASQFKRFTSIDLRKCNQDEITCAADFPENPDLKELMVPYRIFKHLENVVDPLPITCLKLDSVISNAYIPANELNFFVNLVTFKGRVEPSTQKDQGDALDFSALKDLENLFLYNAVNSFKFGSPQKLKRLAFVPLNFDSTGFTDLRNVTSLKLNTIPGKNGSIKNFTTTFFPKLEVLRCEVPVKIEELVTRKTFLDLDVPFNNKQEAIAVISANPNLTTLTCRVLLDKEVFNAVRSLKKLGNFVHVGYRNKNLKWSRLKSLKNLSIMTGSYQEADLLQKLKQIPKLERLHLRITEGAYYTYAAGANHFQKFAEMFGGFPKLKVLIIQDGNLNYPERTDELVKIRGLTYAECKRL